MNDTDISIVIPAYNEEARLPRYLAEIQGYFAPRPTSYEIVVVDDGSVDQTARVVQEIAALDSRVRLVRLPLNRGKGHAVRTGMLQACGRLQLFADADGATPISQLERLLPALERGADVAIASRALRETGCAVQAHLHRKIMGAVFNFLVAAIAVRGIRDTQCGFKLFSKEAAQAVFPLQRIDDFGFDVEILYLCGKRGLCVKEVPVTWSDIEGSKVGVVRDSLRMLGDLFKIRCNDLRGYYRPGGARPNLDG